MSWIRYGFMQNGRCSPEMQSSPRKRRVRVSETVLEFDPALVRGLAEQTDSDLFGQQADGGRTVLRAVRSAWDNELTDCQQRYLSLYYRDRLTMKEIAQLHGVNTATVSRTLRRARNRLQRVLQYYIL